METYVYWFIMLIPPAPGAKPMYYEQAMSHVDCREKIIQMQYGDSDQAKFMQKFKFDCMPIKSLTPRQLFMITRPNLSDPDLFKSATKTAQK